MRLPSRNGRSRPGGAASSAADGRTGPAVTGQAVSELEASAQRNPDDPKGWVLLGLAYLDRNEYPRALEAFQRAVKVGPESAEAQTGLVSRWRRRRICRRPSQNSGEPSRWTRRYGRAYSNLGSTLAQSGDYAGAVQVFRQALALEPNSVGAHLNLGTALRETGNLDEALEHLRKVAEANPNDAAVQYQLGQTLGQSGNAPDAIAAFERALALDPEKREAYYALGSALKQQSAARKATVSPASPADDPVRRAQEPLGQGDLRAARAQLEEAVRLDETDAEAHTLLGFTLGQQGDLPAAILHLERAIALRPDSVAGALPSRRGAVVQRRERACCDASSARASSWIRRQARARLFSAWCCANAAIGPVRARACSTR